MARSLSPITRRESKAPSMGRNLPAVQRELENLDKGAESRKMAMKALKSFVKDLDSKAIPLFLAQVSETKAPSSSSVEHTISLYEVLARVHGPNIVPQIDNIMSTIIKTLTSSAGSFPLQQACSKVVPAMARYGMDPSTPIDKKRDIIASLCKPLSDSLLGSQESLAFGAALCLKALVDSDNWRFASNEIVNEVCLRVAGSLEEKSTQTNSHMGLAMALAKHNNFTVEAYARSLIRSGLRILNAGAGEGNSQKRFSAIQMVNFLMKSLDLRSFSSELEFVIEELEKCHSDPMAFVKGAAFEALQTARTLDAEKGLGLEKESSPITRSNLSRRDYNRRKNLWNTRDRSPVSLSPESQTVNSFLEYDSIAESPTSTGQVSCNFSYGGRSVNRKLWSNENGGVDVSLKDGLYSEGYSGSNGSRIYIEHVGSGEISNDEGDHSGEFSGFVPTTTNGVERSATPSPERRHSRLDLDDIKIFTTPRKLIRSLQDLSDGNSDHTEKQGRRFGSPVSSQYKWNPARNLEQNGELHFLNSKANDDKTSFEVEEQGSNGSESVSSTGDVAADATQQVPQQIGPQHRRQSQSQSQSSSIYRKRSPKAVFCFICALFFILLALILPIIWNNSHEEDFYLPPT